MRSNVAVDLLVNDYNLHRPKPPLRIVVGSDNAGYTYKVALKETLARHKGVAKVMDVGVVDAGDATSYPHLAVHAAKKTKSGEADRALLVCGTGLGVAISANKVTSIHAVSAHDSYSVQRARVIGLELAKKLVQD
ncbi:hypothetical protein DV736_g238, partial [Chaetothyriales sp. CBS 134916]